MTLCDKLLVMVKTRTAWNHQKVIGEKAQRWTCLGTGWIRYWQKPHSLQTYFENQFCICVKRVRRALWNCLNAVWKLLSALYSTTCYLPPLPFLGNCKLNFLVYIYILSAGERKPFCVKSFFGYDLQCNATDVTDMWSAAGMHKSILWADSLISPSRHFGKEHKTWERGTGVPTGQRCSWPQDLVWLFAKVPK